MPKIDPDTGNPMSDAPDQADESAAGGVGRGGFVDANTDEAGPRITTSPDNEREARPGATEGDDGGALSGPNATGGV